MIEVIVKVKDLTVEAFSKFGRVIEAPNFQPLVENENVKYWGTVATFKVEGETEIGICIVKKGSNILEFMERHVQTSEVIIPIEGDFILPVAASKSLEDAGEHPKAEDIEAFYIKDEQAIVLNKGVWHYAPLPIMEEASFFVIFKKETAKHDLDLKKINKEVKIVYEEKSRALREK